MKKYWLIALIGFIFNACIKNTQENTSKTSESRPKTALDSIQKAENEKKTAAPKISAIEQKMLDAGLVPIQSLDSTIKVELKYSTTDNFVGADVYGDFSTGYLQKSAAEKLAKANTLLKKNNADYRLLVYDAARPRSVQQILWDTLQVPQQEKRKYVTNPKEGSIHNYGCAVDLTIFDEKTQKPLDMGTKFDYFGKLAYTTHEDQLLKSGQLSQQQFDNRRLLRRIMLQGGYQEIETEWWHFVAFSRVDTQRKYKIIE